MASLAAIGGGPASVGAQADAQDENRRKMAEDARIPAWRVVRQEQAGIIDYGSTTLIPPNWRFHLDRAGNVIARLSLASKKMR